MVHRNDQIQSFVYSKQLHQNLKQSKQNNEKTTSNDPIITSVELSVPDYN